MSRDGKWVGCLKMVHHTTSELGPRVLREGTIAWRPTGTHKLVCLESRRLRVKHAHRFTCIYIHAERKAWRLHRVQYEHCLLLGGGAEGRDVVSSGLGPLGSPLHPLQ